MLGLSGCQTGKPSWWPGRNKVQYSSASSTPPEGASQYNMPSAKATPYGAQGDHSHGGYDPSNPGGYPADGYGANGYAVAADAAGQNAYSNAAAGGMNAGRLRADPTTSTIPISKPQARPHTATPRPRRWIWRQRLPG